MESIEKILNPETMSNCRVLLEFVGSTFAITGTVGICEGIRGIAEYALLTRSGNKKFVHIDEIPKEMEAPLSLKLDKRGFKKEAALVLKEFIETLNSRGISLDNLFRNFKPYSIDLSRNNRYLMPYSFRSGTLFVDPNNLRESLLRGLLLETASCDHWKFSVTGFERTIYRDRLRLIERDKVTSVGEGLNIAYTEILMNRYFGVEMNSYLEDFVDLTSLLEAIVGEKKMENAFFKGDLRIFVDHDEKATIEWLNKFDYAYNARMHARGLVALQLGENAYRELFMKLAKNILVNLNYHLLQPTSNNTMSDEQIMTIEKRQKMLNRLESILNKRLHRKTKGYNLHDKDYGEILRYQEDLIEDLQTPYHLKPKTNNHNTCF